MNKYSYIIPFYNVKPYTAACLDSILAQTYSNWECICVDDGSPDGLGEILDQYVAKDDRIKVIHQKNAGVGAARNAALEMISGNWFMFVDGDDLTAPLTCEFCERVLAKYPDVDMMSFKESRFPQDGVCDWGREVDNLTMDYRDVSGIVNSWMYQTGFCTRVYRKSVYGKLRFPLLVRGQDRYFLLDCMYETRTMVKVNRVINGVRQRMGSTMRSPMTSAKIDAHSEALRHLIEVVNYGGRSVEQCLFRSQLNKFIEVLIYEWYQIASKEGRRTSFLHWIDILRSIRDAQCIIGFQRFRIHAISRFPFAPVVYALCVLPHLVKKRGFHR